MATAGRMRSASSLRRVVLPAPVSARRRLSTGVPDLTTPGAAPVGGRRSRVAGCRDLRRPAERTLSHRWWSGGSGSRCGSSVLIRAHGNLQRLDEGCPDSRGKGKGSGKLLWTVRAFGGAGKYIRGIARGFGAAHDEIAPRSPCARVRASRWPAAFVLPASSLLHAPESQARRSNLPQGSCDENLRW